LRKKRIMADQGKEGLLSPYLRAQRLKAARPFLRGKVLDVGCGSGVLASLVAAADYFGVDRDEAIVAAARRAFPGHRFDASLPAHGMAFDTVVSLAVIEHVADPAAFLRELKGYLSPTAEARIICTTPHPSVDWVHAAGARLGLFSWSAHEEHQALLDEGALRLAGRNAGLEMAVYRRFLFGANQVATFHHAD
jgi:SAM-dependent methyltransferase